jgi:hypothetical protein
MNVLDYFMNDAGILKDCRIINLKTSLHINSVTSDTNQKHCHCTNPTAAKSLWTELSADVSSTLSYGVVTTEVMVL